MNRGMVVRCAASLLLLSSCRLGTEPRPARELAAPLLRREAPARYWVVSDPWLAGVLFPDPLPVEIEKNGRDFTVTVRWARFPFPDLYRDGYVANDPDGWRAGVLVQSRDGFCRIQDSEVQSRKPGGAYVWHPAKIRRDGNAIRFSCPNEFGVNCDNGFSIDVVLIRHDENADWYHSEHPEPAELALR